MSKALEIMERTEVPKSTARHWLTEAGVGTGQGRSGGRHALLSVAQIEAASVAHESFCRTHGAGKKGSVKAAFNAVDDGSFTYPTFRHYYNKNGLSAYGQAMLERVRKTEAKARESERQEK